MIATNLTNGNRSFKKFLIIWSGEFVSSIGSGLTAFALAIYVYKTTQSATYVSLVTLCAFFPTILLSPVSGVLADRFDRRLLMIIGDSFSALGLIYILIRMKAGHITIFHICIGVTFSALFCALTETSYKASITDLLSEEEFAKASGLVQVAGSSKYLLSPFIAGFLLRIFDVSTILIMDICTFFVTIITVTFVRKSIMTPQITRKVQSFKKDLKEGWQTVSTTRGILILTILISVVTFYMGFLQTLYTPLILPLANVKTLGIIQSVSAVGLLVSSLVIGIFNIKDNHVNTLSIGLGFAGVFFCLMGFTTNLYFITITGFLFFSTLPFINTSADVLIRKNIPNEMQGRAWGIIGVISQLGYVVAYSVSGLLADFVFNPMLEVDGLLSSSIGQIIGTGEGRGIGLLFILSGIFIGLLSLIIYRVKSIRSLEEQSRLLKHYKVN